MFYSSQLLSRKTALGICWLASHLESKRLKRAQVCLADHPKYSTIIINVLKFKRGLLRDVCELPSLVIG
jgi:hypothetical protein